jgi:hypothetical protein
MKQDDLRYDRLVEAALRGVVRDALRAAMPDCMPGDHHFYLTFRTRAPGVKIPAFLLEQYPEEMTIVLQHQFWGLKADDEHFEVTLSFNNRPADLYVPFAALTAFIDPSVKFGLQFNPDSEGEGVNTADGVEPANSGTAPGLPVAADSADVGRPAPITAPSDEALTRAIHEQRAAAKAAADNSGDEAGDGNSDSADVVSLDSFRKK